MKRFSTLFALSLIISSLTAQVPQGINYQAVARDLQGNAIQDQDLTVKVTIYSDDEVEWSENHNVSTNAQGLFSLVIGDPEVAGSGSAASFDLIDWGSGMKELGIEVDDGSGFVDLGRSQFQSVPFALHAVNSSSGGEGSWSSSSDTISSFNFVGIGTSNTDGTSLAVQGLNNEPETPLFEVRREDGVPVFAVFNDGVMVYVDEEAQHKGIKGGFAVGGYKKTNKGVTQEYLRVTPDSVRIWVPEDEQDKGIKGGFAVGGYKKTSKGISQDLMFITPDSIRLYVPNKENDAGVSGLQGGFAVETFDPAASEDGPREYIMGMNRGITRFNTADNRSGFAIGSQGEGWSSTYMKVTPVNTFVGFESGAATRNDPTAWNASQGAMNVFLGYKSGQRNLYGHHNVFMGYRAGWDIQGDSLDDLSGSYNVFLGANAAENLAAGNSNIFLGNAAGQNTDASFENIFIGEFAGQNSSESDGNIAIGNRAGQITASSANIYIGTNSGMNNLSGESNVMIGNNSGANAFGSGNVFLGNEAGKGYEGDNALYIENSDSSLPLVWGDFAEDKLRLNAEVGINAHPVGNRLKIIEDRVDHWGAAIHAENNRSEDVGVGIEAYGGSTGIRTYAYNYEGGTSSGQHTGLHAYASGGSANYGVSAYAYGTTRYALYADANIAYYGALYSLSDKKFKKNIESLKPVMGDLMKLQARHYEVTTPSDKKAGNPSYESQYGFVAQELEEVFPDLVQEITPPSHSKPGADNPELHDPESIKAVKYMEMIPLLLKGLQEQQTEIEALKAEIAALKAQQ